MSMQSRPKIKSRKSRNQSVDMISNLPDSILSHILSYLPTVEAVATCILSTKWKNLWINLDTLTFDDSLSPFHCHYNDEYSPSNMKFAGFVNRVLHFPRDNPLVKFSLHCDSNSELYGISTWISISIMKGVRELHLWIMTGEPVQLPGCLFSCTTLELLKLAYRITIKMPPVVYLPNLIRMDLIDIRCETDALELISRCTSLNHLTIDSYILYSLCSNTLTELHLFDVRIKGTPCLPNLRVLTLDLVVFGEHTTFPQEYASNLISSFPSLDSLIVHVYDVWKLTISSSTLRDLKIERPPSYEDDSDSLELELDAPALQHLNLGSWRLTNVCIKDSSSLIDAVVRWEFTPTIYDQSYNSTMCTLFHGFCNVKVLYLSRLCMRGTIPDHKFPKFPKLTELRVEVECASWPLLQQIINNSNTLEDLILVYEKDFCKDTNCGHILSWKHPNVVPECLLSSFRRLHFYGFQGFQHELAMVEYLLKNVGIMNRMVIEICPSLDEYIKKNLRKKLLKFRRGSPECEITVCSDDSMSNLRDRWTYFFSAHILHSENLQDSNQFN